jgi:hypothetical protein
MGWVFNATPRPLHSGKETRYALCRWFGEPQGRSGRVRKISPPLGFDLRNVPSVACRYTDWGIPATLVTTERGKSLPMCTVNHTCWQRLSVHVCTNVLTNVFALVLESISKLSKIKQYKVHSEASPVSLQECCCKLTVSLNLHTSPNLT